MKIEQQKVGTVDVFTPTGPLIEQDAEQFVNTIVNQIQTGNSRMVISLHEVPYMDSVALEGFINVVEIMEGQAVEMKLAKVTATCREIFELTGISNRFRFFNDIQDAVKSYL